MRGNLIAEEDLIQVVRSEILSDFPAKRILLFYGPMGAGKTTVIREIARQIGVLGSVKSPTFGYVNNYSTDKSAWDKLGIRTFYHFDLYRMVGVEEFINAGFDEVLCDSSAAVAIEWPEILGDFLRQKSCGFLIKKIKLGYYGQCLGKRVLSVYAD